MQGYAANLRVLLAPGNQSPRGLKLRVLSVGGGVLLLPVGAIVIGVILLGMGILAAVGIYRQHRFARLYR